MNPQAPNNPLGAPPIMPVRRAPSPQMARICVGINIGLFPGWGTLLARRWVVGIFQSAMSGTGFFLAISAFFSFYQQLVAPEGAIIEEISPLAARVFGGIAIFGLAWVWALLSSFSILRDSRLAERHV